MTELALVKNNDLDVWECETRLKDIRTIYGKDLNDGEFKTFVEVGRRTGMNPFLREIWCVKYDGKAASIFLGRDGYRKNAQAHPNYDYHQVHSVHANDLFEIADGEIMHRYSFKDRGALLGAYCVVKRKSSSKVMYVYVDIKEYNTTKSQWGQRPITMIKKVAEAQALKMAFQELFSGTHDESEQDFIEGSFTEAKVTTAQEVNASLGLIESHTAYDEADVKLTQNDFSHNFMDCKTVDELKETFEKQKNSIPKEFVSSFIAAKDKRKAELDELEKWRKEFDETDAK